jgi:general secretion pathway protein G
MAFQPGESARRRAGGRGFTLIELLVVLAIIAVMLTLAVPRYFGQLQTAKEVVLRDNLKTTRDVIDKFYGDTGRYPDSLDELVDKHYLRALPADPIADSANAWTLVPPPEGYQGNVYDIKSVAPGNAKDGMPYAQM